MLTYDKVRGWRGRVVLDREGNKAGTISEVYLDEEVDEPGWALVSGLPGAGAGTGAVLVPIHRAVEDGNEIRVPYDLATILGAPGMPEEGYLTPPQEAELYAYYDLPYSGTRWEPEVIDGEGGFDDDPSFY